MGSMRGYPAAEIGRQRERLEQSLGELKVAALQRAFGWGDVCQWERKHRARETQILTFPLQSRVPPSIPVRDGENLKPVNVDPRWCVLRVKRYFN